MNFWQLTGAFYGAAGVAAGAAASHALSDAYAADMVKTAAIYALIHAAVLVCWQSSGKIALAARLCLAAGVLLFSGAIMLKYLLACPVAAHAAPVGGTLLMLAWLFIAVHAALDGKSGDKDAA